MTTYAVAEQSIPFYIHQEDDEITVSAWPLGYPVPRWGEGFVFQDTNFLIEDAEWRMESIEVPNSPDNVSNVVLSYHIYITEGALADKEDLLPDRFK